MFSLFMHRSMDANAFLQSLDKPYIIYAGGVDRQGHGYIAKFAHSSRQKVCDAIGAADMGCS